MAYMVLTCNRSGFDPATSVNTHTSKTNIYWAYYMGFLFVFRGRLFCIGLVFCGGGGAGFQVFGVFHSICVEYLYFSS